MQIITDMELLAEIDRFCAEQYMNDSLFSRLAVNSSSYTWRLRQGKGTTLKSAGKVLAFIAEGERLAEIEALKPKPHVPTLKEKKAAFTVRAQKRRDDREAGVPRSRHRRTNAEIAAANVRASSNEEIIAEFQPKPTEDLRATAKGLIIKVGDTENGTAKAREALQAVIKDQGGANDIIKLSNIEENNLAALITSLQSLLP